MTNPPKCLYHWISTLPIIKVPFLPKNPCIITCECVNGEVACQRDSCFGFEGGNLVKGGGDVIKAGGYGYAKASSQTVKIGRKEVTLPYVKLGVLSVIRDGHKIVVRSNVGIRVVWDRYDTTQVFIPRVYKGKVCGLCGNFNGNPKDDFRTKHGLRASDINSFFNSWKVGRRKKQKDEIVLKLYQYNRSKKIADPS